jgi:hypothetical protein
VRCDKASCVKRHDERAEVLIVIGIMVAGAGILGACGMVLIANLKHLSLPLLIAIPPAVLIASGVGLGFLRRWGGIAVATLSLLASGVYLFALTRSDGWTAEPLALNVGIAVVCALPAVLIVRWRRFLR